MVTGQFYMDRILLQAMWKENNTLRIIITKSYYVKGKNKYEKLGQKQVVTYHDEDLHFFPRMWDNSNDQGHADYYASFAGYYKGPENGSLFE